MIIYQFLVSVHTISRKWTQTQHLGKTRKARRPKECSYVTETGCGLAVDLGFGFGFWLWNRLQIIAMEPFESWSFDVLV